jgi:16S rRNA (guanine966-N2)-methyltransferase
MRVIAGEFRSRPLTAPRGLGTRPTSDRLRETLFNILAASVHQSVFVDLYAGTGAVGIEALSRGAAQVYFAEMAAPALAALRANLHTLGITERCSVETRGALPLLHALAKSGVRADMVYVDPPYADAAAYVRTFALLAELPVLAREAIIVVEHSSHAPAPQAPDAFVAYRTLRQGDAQVTFYRVASTGGENAPPV